MASFKCEDFVLIGDKLKKGDVAPDFELYDIDMHKRTLNDWKGKIKILSVIPSINTGICDTQAKNFINKYANDDEIVVLNISVDLPFAFSTWCEANNKKAIGLSDYRNRSFGKAYGVLMSPHMILYRAMFIIDKNDKIVLADYNEDVTQHVNYELVYKTIDEIK